MLDVVYFILSLVSDWIWGSDWLLASLNTYHPYLQIIITLSPMYTYYKSLQHTVLVYYVFTRHWYVTAANSGDFWWLATNCTVNYQLWPLTQDWCITLCVLWPTVSWPVCLGVRHPSGAHGHVFITLGIRVCGRRDPLCWPRDILCPQKLAPPSPTSGGRSVGIVRSRTKVTVIIRQLLIC
jgi:hypothetical protein